MKMSPNNCLLSAIAVLTAALLAVYGCGGGGDDNSASTGSPAPTTTATPTACSAPSLRTEYVDPVLFRSDAQNRRGGTTRCALTAGDYGASQLALVSCADEFPMFGGFGGTVLGDSVADIDFVFTDLDGNGTIERDEFMDSSETRIAGDIILTNGRRTLRIEDFILNTTDYGETWFEGDCVPTGNSVRSEDADGDGGEPSTRLLDAVIEILSGDTDASGIDEEDVDRLATELNRLGTDGSGQRN